jgi:hypothetical protein
MSTVLELERIDSPTRHRQMVHLICCNERRAICGASIAGVRANHLDLDCVVCSDMELLPCPTCGRTWE